MSGLSLYTHSHATCMNNAHIFDKEIKFFLKVAWYRKCHFQYQSLHHDISSLYNDNCHYYIPCTSVVYSYTHSHTNLLVRSRVWYSGLDEGFGTRLSTTIHTHATCMYNTHIFDKFFLKVAWYRKCHFQYRSLHQPNTTRRMQSITLLHFKNSQY